ncbi:VOC family protein [Litorimonas sp.]|jgi:catechol 2,3-dioxygenase-like lactoylglutathione lyase family enzyme|uniref:VOC family protein n=1 Tax=Litorimonas sp. TaxID=1892381 RepID=UPI003A84C901
MLAYTTVGTNDYDAANEFYAELLKPLGAKQLWATDRFAGYGRKSGDPMFAVCKPYDENPATAGNGTMITLGCQNQEQVKELHDKAVELGGKSEGEPGPRGETGQFYMAYIRDLDGNKIAFFAPGKVQAEA